VRRRLGLIAAATLALVLVGCGSRADPFVGYWQQAGGKGTMLLNVAPQKSGRYPVTWNSGSGAGATRLDVYEKGDGVYADFAGDVFTMIGTTQVEMRFTDVYGKHVRVTFKRTDTSSDERAWDPD
jgi:hypothetical protein